MMRSFPQRMCVCVFIYLFICFFIFLCIYLFIYLSRYFQTRTLGVEMIDDYPDNASHVHMDVSPLVGGLQGRVSSPHWTVLTETI